MQMQMVTKRMIESVHSISFRGFVRRFLVQSNDSKFVGRHAQANKCACFHVNGGLCESDGWQVLTYLAQTF